VAEASATVATLVPSMGEVMARVPELQRSSSTPSEVRRVRTWSVVEGKVMGRRDRGMVRAVPAEPIRHAELVSASMNTGLERDGTSFWQRDANGS
jgi:hypothetical protein